MSRYTLCINCFNIGIGIKITYVLTYLGSVLNFYVCSTIENLRRLNTLKNSGFYFTRHITNVIHLSLSVYVTERPSL